MNISVPPWHPYPADDAFQYLDETDATMEGQCQQWWPEDGILQTEHRTNEREWFPFRRQRCQGYDMGWAQREVSPKLRNKSHYCLLDWMPWLRGWNKDAIEIVMGQAMPDILRLARRLPKGQAFILDHDLHLKSAYASVLGHEPELTSAHDISTNTLDYVLYSPAVHRSVAGRDAYVKLVPFRVLKTPRQTTNDRLSLPNGHFGSDHFSLCVDFCVKATNKFYDAGLPLPPPSLELQLFQRPIRRQQSWPRHRARRPRHPSNGQTRQRKRRRQRGAPSEQDGQPMDVETRFSI